MSKKRFSANAASLRMMRARGYIAETVEQRIPHAMFTRDLFNVIDIIAIHPEVGIVGIQTTTAKNAQSRIRKIQDEPIMETWFKSGGKLAVHGWKKLGKRSGTPGKIICEEYDITLT